MRIFFLSENQCILKPLTYDQAVQPESWHNVPIDHLPLCFCICDGRESAASQENTPVMYSWGWWKVYSEDCGGKNMEEQGCDSNSEAESEHIAIRRT